MRRTVGMVVLVTVLGALGAGTALAQAENVDRAGNPTGGPYDQPEFRGGAPSVRLDPASEYARGLDALQDKRYRAAVRSLGRVADTAPAFAGAWRALGAAYAGQARWDASRRAYKRALYLRPDEVVSHAGLAVALVALNDPKAQEQAEWLRARAAACNDECPEAETFRALETSGPFAKPPSS